MGRAGGGGGHSSGGSHSFSGSRSSSGHSFSSGGGRAGRSSGGTNRSSVGSGVHYHPVRNHNTYVYYDGGEGYYTYDYSAVRMWVGLLVFLLVFGMLVVIATQDKITASTVAREKLELGYGYTNNNIVDEVGWLKNPDRMNRTMKEFYEKTGVVPYVVLLNRPEVWEQGEYAESEYAQEIYEEWLDHEGYALLVYFSSGQEDYGTDGDCQLVIGRQASVLMDAEAQQIFWDYLDSLWYSDVDEDTVFADVWVKTGNRIMKQMITGVGVYIAFIRIGIAIVTIGVVIFVSRKFRERRRAEENMFD